MSGAIFATRLLYPSAVDAHAGADAANSYLGGGIGGSAGSGSRTQEADTSRGIEREVVIVDVADRCDTSADDVVSQRLRGVSRIDVDGKRSGVCRDTLEGIAPWGRVAKGEKPRSTRAAVNTVVTEVVDGQAGGRVNANAPAVRAGDHYVRRRVYAEKDYHPPTDAVAGKAPKPTGTIKSGNIERFASTSSWSRAGRQPCHHAAWPKRAALPAQRRQRDSRLTRRDRRARLSGQGQAQNGNFG